MDEQEDPPEDESPEEPAPSELPPVSGGVDPAVSFSKVRIPV